MKVFSKIDFNTGKYIEDILAEESEAIKDSSLVDVRVTDGMISPVWNGSSWVESAPTEVLIINARRVKLTEITDKFNQALGQLANQYPQLERESWTQQEKESRAYISDNTTPTPMLDALATARGVAKDVLAQKIVEKADQYAQAAGTLIGKRQALEDAINAATTIEELEEITWG